MSKIDWFKLDEFTRGYIECALWSSHIEDAEDSTVEYMDEKYTYQDIADETCQQMLDDCAAFQFEMRERLAQEYANDERGSSNEGCTGHDFWLTRNGHGAGFWDGDWPTWGDVLSEACKKFGQFDLYVGDDGKIYGTKG